MGADLFPTLKYDFYVVAHVTQSSFGISPEAPINIVPRALTEVHTALLSTVVERNEVIDL